MSKKFNKDNWDISKGPRNFIQWKGTQVCLDFHCTCGNSPHIDDEFVYAIRCGNCGKVWSMGTEVQVTELTDTKDYWYEHATQTTSVEEDE